MSWLLDDVFQGLVYAFTRFLQVDVLHACIGTSNTLTKVFRYRISSSSSSLVVMSWSRWVLGCMGECQDSVVLLVDDY